MPGTGTILLDFGVFPGASHAKVEVTGIGGIVAGSLVEAWLRPEATPDHTADEHMVESIKVFAADIVPGSGFWIHGFNTSEVHEASLPQALSHQSVPAGRDRLGSGSNKDNHPRDKNARKGTRIWGRWTVAYAWT